MAHLTLRSEISADWRTTIPVEVLAMLGIQPGDRVRFEIDCERVTLHRADGVEEPTTELQA